uniref:Uncharacterized protein n=1 Tax=Stomoxys calcitrans TaxID=35570 RepID=A0A1I8NP03_STOCA
MSGRKLKCPICTEDVQERDETYTTSGDRIDHFSCMQQWQSRGASRPECRNHNPTSHKLILNDAPAESTAAVNEQLVEAAFVIAYFVYYCLLLFFFCIIGQHCKAAIRYVVGNFKNSNSEGLVMLSKMYRKCKEAIVLIIKRSSRHYKPKNFTNKT